jgi:amino acid permease
MASTGFEAGGSPKKTMHGKENYDDKEYKLDETPSAYGVRDDEANPAYDSTEKLVQDSTHRKLKPRHIQLIGIGGYVVAPANCLITY